MKTIRQIADELGVSKQAVFKKIKNEPLSTSLQGLMETVDGRLTVSVDGEKLIKQAFSKGLKQCAVDDSSTKIDGLVDDSSTKVDAPSTTSSLTSSLMSDGVVSVLQTTIDTLQEQLAVKDRQIEQQAQTITQLTEALSAAQQAVSAAQALHAGTIQQQLTSGQAAVKEEDQQDPAESRSWFHRLFRL